MLRQRAAVRLPLYFYLVGRRDRNGISKYPTIRRFTTTSPVRVEILRRLHSANGLLESRLFPRTAMEVARTRESLAMCDTSERAKQMLWHKS